MAILAITLCAALARLVLAQSLPEGIQGFNSGNTFADGSAKQESDFRDEFETAQRLRASPGRFDSVRLYTMIQAETEAEPISAIQAAIDTQTTMLLGIWCSHTATIDDELAALEAAVERYGDELADLVVGISVGSEDLYRVSESGLENDPDGFGQPASRIVEYIGQVREAIRGTVLGSKAVGHVDTWSAWANSSNADVVAAVDWVGVDLYPYYEKDKGNDFGNATEVYEYILGQAEGAVGDKPVWVTETGWPLSGPDFGEAEASVDNAKGYWREIGCGRLFGRTNVWWYNLRDSNPANEEKFAISEELSVVASFNLTCPAGSGAPEAVNLDSEDADAGHATSPLGWLAVSAIAGLVFLAA